MNFVVFMMLLFAVVCCGPVLGIAVTKRRFEEFLPMSIGGIPMALLFCGLVFGLQAAFVIVLVLAAGMIVFAAVWMIRNRTGRETAGRLLTPGFLLFALLYCALFGLHAGRLATGFDEFSHWVDTVKAMTLLNDFSSNAEAQILFESYPPGMALIQFFFQKVYLLIHPGTGFTEWLCYPAYQLLMFSFFFPMLRKMSWKQVIPMGLLLVLSCFLPMALYDTALTMTYIDPFLGVVTGCGFFLLYNREKSDRVADWTLLVTLFTLVMAKDTGLLCAAFLGVTAGISELVSLRGKDQKQRVISLLFILGIVCFVAIPKLAWKAHYTGRGFGKSFSQPIDLGVAWSVITGTNTGWQEEGFRHYLHALMTTPVPVGSTGLEVLYPLLFGLLTVFLLGSVWLRRKKADNGQRVGAVGSALLFCLVYSIGLGFIYLFKFGESGTRNLLSFDRYLRVPYLALLIFLFLVAAYEWLAMDGKRKWIWFIPLLVAGILLLPMKEVKAIITRSSVGESQETRAPYDKLAAEVLADAEMEHPWVYIVAQHDSGWCYYMTRYCLRPAYSTGWTLMDGGGGEGVQNRTAETWMEELKDYDYVAIVNTDSEFVETYGTLFAGYRDGTPAISVLTVYRVDHAKQKLIRADHTGEDILEDPLDYVPGTEIRFDNPETIPWAYMVSGFSVPEKGFIWSDGEETVIRLRPVDAVDTDFEADWTNAGVIGIQPCEIYAGEEQLYFDILDGNTRSVHLYIPRSALDEDGILEIRFVFPDADVPENGDPRVLAVAFKSLRIYETK